MKLHLVGGFLGSGKTTAIIQAARLLMDNGLQVGVITNDQGKYLVDTAFFRLADLPAVEVTGGCFCCNYDDLDGRLTQLIDTSNPDVIFAESVGSCADVVATVVKPLLELGKGRVQPSSFSVFTDARMLRRRLSGGEMPFSEDVVYIYDKQLEEAGLIIANKEDLLSETAREEVRTLLLQAYPKTPSLIMSAQQPDNVFSWLDLIQSGTIALPPALPEIDYDRYGTGEAQLAWLDETLLVRFPEGHGRPLLVSFFERMLALLSERKAAIGHLKFILEGSGVQVEGHGVKLSFTTLEEPGWGQHIPEVIGDHASLLVNARVEMPASELLLVLDQALNESGLEFTVENSLSFHPPQPQPTHRMA